MLQVTDDMIRAAKETISRGNAEAVGYRILIKSIFVDTELENGMKELAPTLAASGFQGKSKEEAERQSRGTFFGIVCDLGDHAYGNPHLGEKKWVDVGDVAIFERYAGIGIEIPPDSGDEYRFMNDENIVGKMLPESED